MEKSKKYACWCIDRLDEATGARRVDGTLILSPYGGRVSNSAEQTSAYHHLAPVGLVVPVPYSTPTPSESPDEGLADQDDEPDARPKSAWVKQGGEVAASDLQQHSTEPHHALRG